ncbi:hypothetical protein HYH03_003782 [Edaphochlamys debaryana]|uniref:Uncharacterized protein n=1 Tax=Edaphochlamys debaryana TaxID=47281 RepID=A0A835YBM2_9CHLO|nr:hypothetical protein HYH03_003782 [Edaphochlamys debaryana]|eukprot:KAG2498532.1 hypothetical protein HYH03_003782 [Edaphochlamys debaryana]
MPAFADAPMAPARSRPLRGALTAALGSAAAALSPLLALTCWAGGALLRGLERVLARFGQQPAALPQRQRRLHAVRASAAPLRDDASVAAPESGGRCLQPTAMHHLLRAPPPAFERPPLPPHGDAPGSAIRRRPWQQQVQFAEPVTSGAAASTAVTSGAAASSSTSSSGPSGSISSHIANRLVPQPQPKSHVCSPPGGQSRLAVSGPGGAAGEAVFGLALPELLRGLSAADPHPRYAQAARALGSGAGGIGRDGRHSASMPCMQSVARGAPRGFSGDGAAGATVRGLELAASEGSHADEAFSTPLASAPSAPPALPARAPTPQPPGAPHAPTASEAAEATGSGPSPGAPEAVASDTGSRRRPSTPISVPGADARQFEGALAAAPAGPSSWPPRQSTLYRSPVQQVAVAYKLEAPPGVPFERAACAIAAAVQSSIERSMNQGTSVSGAPSGSAASPSPGRWLGYAAQVAVVRGCVEVVCRLQYSGPELSEAELAEALACLEDELRGILREEAGQDAGPGEAAGGGTAGRLQPALWATDTPTSGAAALLLSLDPPVLTAQPPPEFLVMGASRPDLLAPSPAGDEGAGPRPSSSGPRPSSPGVGGSSSVGGRLPRMSSGDCGYEASSEVGASQSRGSSYTGGGSTSVARLAASNSLDLSGASAMEARAAFAAATAAFARKDRSQGGAAGGQDSLRLAAHPATSAGAAAAAVAAAVAPPEPHPPPAEPPPAPPAEDVTPFVAKPQRRGPIKSKTFHGGRSKQASRVPHEDSALEPGMGPPGQGQVPRATSQSSEAASSSQGTTGDGMVFIPMMGGLSGLRRQASAPLLHASAGEGDEPFGGGLAGYAASTAGARAVGVARGLRLGPNEAVDAASTDEEAFYTAANAVAAEAGAAEPAQRADGRRRLMQPGAQRQLQFEAAAEGAPGLPSETHEGLVSSLMRPPSTSVRANLVLQSGGGAGASAAGAMEVRLVVEQHGAVVAEVERVTVGPQGASVSLDVSGLVEGFAALLVLPSRRGDPQPQPAVWASPLYLPLAVMPAPVAEELSGLMERMEREAAAQWPDLPASTVRASAFTHHFSALVSDMASLLLGCERAAAEAEEAGLRAGVRSAHGAGAGPGAETDAAAGLEELTELGSGLLSFLRASGLTATLDYLLGEVEATGVQLEEDQEPVHQSQPGERGADHAEHGRNDPVEESQHGPAWTSALPPAIAWAINGFDPPTEARYEAAQHRRAGGLLHMASAAVLAAVTSANGLLCLLALAVGGLAHMLCPIRAAGHGEGALSVEAAMQLACALRRLGLLAGPLLAVLLALPAVLHGPIIVGQQARPSPWRVRRLETLVCGVHAVGVLALCLLGRAVPAVLSAVRVAAVVTVVAQPALYAVRPRYYAPCWALDAALLLPLVEAGARAWLPGAACVTLVLALSMAGCVVVDAAEREAFLAAAAAGAEEPAGPGLAGATEGGAET